MGVWVLSLIPTPHPRLGLSLRGVRCSREWETGPGSMVSEEWGEGCACAPACAPEKAPATVASPLSSAGAR